MDTHRVPSTLSAPACDLQSERTSQEAAAEGGPPFKRICVFCGSSSGSRPEYVAAAVALGQRMVNEGIELVYGGGTVGLMGAIALTVVQGLGSDGVIGVIPEALAPRELSGEMIGRLTEVPDMHTRKALMAKHADGFIAMPGGFGTLEELMEVLTWQQLGFHSKPIGLLNIRGFFNPLIAFFSHCVTEGFVQPQYQTVIVSDDPEELLKKMRAFKAPESFIGRHLRQTGPDGVDVSGAAAASSS